MLSWRAAGAVMILVPLAACASSSASTPDSTGAVGVDGAPSSVSVLVPTVPPPSTAVPTPTSTEATPTPVTTEAVGPVTISVAGGPQPTLVPNSTQADVGIGPVAASWTTALLGNSVGAAT